MTSGFIPTAAVVALEELTTHMDFAGGDGWMMSQDQKGMLETSARDEEEPESADERPKTKKRC
jgi:hypothetical protein